MASPGVITFDESQWPLLVVKHPADPVDKQRTVEYLDHLETYFHRGENFVGIFDVSVSKPPTAEHRFMVATWIKAKQQLIKLNYQGTAYVMPNLIQRLVLTTFLKFMDTTDIIGPVEVFNSMDVAVAWANKRLSAVSEELEK